MALLSPFISKGDAEETGAPSLRDHESVNQLPRCLDSGRITGGHHSQFTKEVPGLGCQYQGHQRTAGADTSAHQTPDWVTRRVLVVTRPTHVYWIHLN